MMEENQKDLLSSQINIKNNAFGSDPKHDVLVTFRSMFSFYWMNT